MGYIVFTIGANDDPMAAININAITHMDATETATTKITFRQWGKPITVFFLNQTDKQNFLKKIREYYQNLMYSTNFAIRVKVSVVQ